MKDAIVISLVLCFALLSVRNTLIWTYFKLNQDYIAENFCRNKAVVQKGCHGTCQLKDMLQIVEQEDEALPFPVLPSWKVEEHFFPHNDLHALEALQNHAAHASLEAVPSYISRLSHADIFRPPQA